MTPQRKQSLIAAASVLVIVASCTWIYFTQFGAAKHNVVLHKRVGEVLAEQTVKVVGSKGRIVIVAMETKGWPELKTQLDAFKSRLDKLGKFEVKEYLLDTKDQPKYGLGRGLSARRLVRIVNKNLGADAIVSFVGTPNMNDEQFGELTKMPRFIVEAASPYDLPKLFDKKMLQVAIVARFQFPSPGGTSQPKTPDAWFNNRYQIVTAEDAAAWPKPE